MSQPFLGTTHMHLDMLHLETPHVFPLDPREQIPDPLVWIPCWRRARHAFEMHACGFPCGQQVFDGLTAMNRGTVPQAQQGTGDVARQHRHPAGPVDEWSGVCMNILPSEVIPPRAERWSRVTVTCTVGVCPLGADVRPASGATSNADGSTTTMVRLSRVAFC